nr:helix-turn-helix transcriptional regulator [Oscillatoria sp. FACHB-1406]
MAVIMADREMSNKELARLVDLHPTSVSRLRKRPLLKLDIPTLDALCKALNCQPGDLLVYEEDESES